jgi:hypothetical protein
VVSAGDFNRDGFGDLLIAAPGVRFTDANGRDRFGVAYLIFGGTHLDGNRSFSLDQVGSRNCRASSSSPRSLRVVPTRRPIDNVGFFGDINGDGFDDIGLGITRADFLDTALPQNPNDPGTNPNIGRRPDDGNVYIVYGNNTGIESVAGAEPIRRLRAWPRVRPAYSGARPIHRDGRFSHTTSRAMGRSRDSTIPMEHHRPTSKPCAPASPPFPSSPVST